MTSSVPTAAKTQPPTAPTHIATGQITVPRITIKFCTQCKWNFRAAYYAQELLQTFSTSLGEVALLPLTSGTFVIELYHHPYRDEHVVEPNMLGEDGETAGPRQVQQTTIWDRKIDGGFPETKELKNRVRNVIEPSRGLGHTDRALREGKNGEKGEAGQGDDDAQNATGADV